MQINIDHKYDNRIQVFTQALGLTEQDVRAAIARSYTAGAGNADAIRKVFSKAARGEEITVAAIGGSITEGASARSINGRGNNATEYTDALDGENNWFNRLTDWFQTAFPETTVNAVNAGIGATPSFLGTFRLEQMILRHKPDFVTVEFSVNDPSTTHNLLENEIFDAYESIVRRCLEANIAVVLIFMNDQDNNGLQRIHSKIAEHYGVPTISYHNAVYPDGQLICPWEKLSPDEIHPNNVGHAFLATCLCNYLDTVLQTTEQSVEYQRPALPENWLYSDTFYKVFARYAYEFADSASGDFVYDEAAPNCKKWKGALLNGSGVGTVRLTVPKGAKRVWVQYFNERGSFETDMAGQKTVCNTSAIGWPKAVWHRIHTGAPLAEDTPLEITTHRSGKVILMGLLASF